MTKYGEPAAFRRALEDRLRSSALQSKVPLDRLRKEAAGQRLLARLNRSLPQGTWALKGGLALIARLDTRARATKDIDATWRDDAEDLDEYLNEAVEVDLHDFFEFEIGVPKQIEAEGPEGGWRYRVLSRLDGREFERLQLDINVVPSDPRPVDHVQLRNPFAFAALDDVSVPVISVAQHLAEKLHAYCRSYGEQVNSRPKDLFDMLSVAHDLPIPDRDDLRDACMATFSLRDTPLPTRIDPPPIEWAATWASYVRDYSIRWSTLDDAFDAVKSFWVPVLNSESKNVEWLPTTWRWGPTTNGSTMARDG